MNLRQSAEDRRGIVSRKMTQDGALVGLVGALLVVLLGFILSSQSALSAKVDAKIDPIAADVSALKSDVAVVKSNALNRLAVSEDQEHRLRTLEGETSSGREARERKALKGGR